MAYNGSGTFLINSAGQPVVTGTTITTTAFNALTADLATGLSTAITKDGQTTPTANIPMGGFKLTGLGVPTTSGDALSYAQNVGTLVANGVSINGGTVAGAIGIGMLNKNLVVTGGVLSLDASTYGTGFSISDFRRDMDNPAVFLVSNQDAGTNASTTLRVSNGTSQCSIVQRGTGYTSSGITRQNGSEIYGTGAGGLTFVTSVDQPIYFAPNNTASGNWTDNLFTISTPVNYGGVTLSNSVTGTGSMALSANPTFTGVVSSASDDITNGNITTTPPALRIGADLNASTRTNATRKLGMVAGYHYTNAEEAVGIIAYDSNTSASRILIGGGAAAYNASTAIEFYTAAGTTTTSGTLAAMIGLGLQVGAAPTGGDKGAGTINVSGDIYKNNTAYTNPDYVLEHWATGAIVKYADKNGAAEYAGLRPLPEVEAYIRENLHLPGFGQEAAHGMFSGSDALLARLEEAYLYIFELEKRVKTLEQR